MMFSGILAEASNPPSTPPSPCWAELLYPLPLDAVVVAPPGEGGAMATAGPMARAGRWSVTSRDVRADDIPGVRGGGSPLWLLLHLLLPRPLLLPVDLDRSTTATGCRRRSPHPPPTRAAAAAPPPGNPPSPFVAIAKGGDVIADAADDGGGGGGGGGR